LVDIRSGNFLVALAHFNGLGKVMPFQGVNVACDIFFLLFLLVHHSRNFLHKIHFVTRTNRTATIVIWVRDSKYETKRDKLG
jgi:hypothetical protein